MDPMNRREKLGAIPILGTIIGAMTLYKNRSHSSTDKKISGLITPMKVLSEASPVEVKTVYQRRLKKLEESSIDKRNARHELIPIWGTIHHLFWRFMPLPHNTRLHSLREQPAFIRAEAAITTLKELGKPEEAADVQAALNLLKKDPHNEDKILHLFTTIQQIIH